MTQNLQLLPAVIAGLPRRARGALLNRQGSELRATLRGQHADAQKHSRKTVLARISESTAPMVAIITAQNYSRMANNWADEPERVGAVASMNLEECEAALYAAGYIRIRRESDYPLVRDSRYRWVPTRFVLRYNWYARAESLSEEV